MLKLQEYRAAIPCPGQPIVSPDQSSSQRVQGNVRRGRKGAIVTFVIEMRPSERVIIDTATLDELFRRLGDRGAETLVMETVEAISDTLVEVDTLVREDRLDEIAPRAQRVSRLSAEIGMTSLARVSRDLGLAARLGDHVAYRAVWERLVRIGDRSLALVWDVPGLRI